MHKGCEMACVVVVGSDAIRAVKLQDISIGFLVGIHTYLE